MRTGTGRRSPAPSAAAALVHEAIDVAAARRRAEDVEDLLVADLRDQAHVGRLDAAALPAPDRLRLRPLLCRVQDVDALARRDHAEERNAVDPAAAADDVGAAARVRADVGELREQPSADRGRPTPDAAAASFERLHEGDLDEDL